MSKFKCYRCGWCCKIEKYSSPQEFELAAKALSKRGIILKGARLANGMILWPRPCPALLTKKDGTTSCAIYDVRPYPCRQFLCGKQSANDERPFTTSGFNMPYYEKQLAESPEFSKIKEKLEETAAKWGNAHGWKLERVK